jgi:hypothetical protein
MTEIVINDKGAGFRLSPEAIKLYLSKLGKDAYFYIYDIQKNIYNKIDYDKIDGWSFVYTKDKGDSFKEYDEDAGCEADVDEFFDDECKRDDKLLIEVIKELRVEKASGHSCILKIVEIPDDVKWEIEENDMGAEWISEIHRRWE